MSDAEEVSSVQYVVSDNKPFVPLAEFCSETEQAPVPSVEVELASSLELAAGLSKEAEHLRVVNFDIQEDLKYKEEEINKLKGAAHDLRLELSRLKNKQDTYWRTKAWLLAHFTKIVNYISHHTAILFFGASYNKCQDCNRRRFFTFRYKETECYAKVWLCPSCLMVAKDRFGLKLVRIKSPWQLATKG